jgi:hypothetical protein
MISEQTRREMEYGAALLQARNGTPAEAPTATPVAASAATPDAAPKPRRRTAAKVTEAPVTPEVTPEVTPAAPSVDSFEDMMNAIDATSEEGV